MASVNPLKPGEYTSRDIAILRNVVPLHTLPDEIFEELLEDLEVEDLREGEVLFRQGDTDHVSFYLLEGKVALLSGGKLFDTLEAGSEHARFPVAHVLPRKMTARAAERVRVARLDSRRVSELLARTHSVDYQVDELEEADADDWMSMLLRCRVLQQLPASNIQRVMMSVEQVEVAKGEDLIRQGEPGDYFYMLIHGQAVVRREQDGGEPVELAWLGPGDAFGEEALLSDRPRNSTVSMLSDGLVLRLGKQQFIELIRTPLSTRIGFDEAVHKVDQGAVWVDLRPPEEYEADHFPGSINLPVESLRYQLASLAPDRHYVLYSNSGGRAGVAAFLMIDQGFEVSILEGGLDRLRAEQPAENLPPASEVPDSSPEALLQERSELHRRVLEAEQRARELEQRLKVAEATAQGVEQQKQEQLQAVKAVVDQARARLRASELECRTALAERQKAYEEMEALTSTLERLESERAELGERMREIEGLDKKLQARLEKVERELVGERERAESASEALEEIGERLHAVMEEREAEREKHAREAGELKEEITVLQMELEQTRLELQELRLVRQGAADAEGRIAGDPGEWEAKCEASEAVVAELQETLAEERDQRAALQAQVEALNDTVQIRDQEVAQLQRQLEETQAALDQKGRSEDSLRDELARLRDAVAEFEQERQSLAGALAAREDEIRELRGVMETYVEQITQAKFDEAEQLEALKREMAVLREESEREITRLREELAAAREQLERSGDAPRTEQSGLADLEVTRRELHDVQHALAERQHELALAEESRQLLEDALEEAHAEIDRVRRELDRLAVETEEAVFRAEEAEKARARLQQELKRFQEEIEQAKLEDLRDERVRGGKVPLDIDAVWNGTWTSRLISILIGSGLTLALLEGLSLLAGRGELLGGLFELLGK